jgi:secreted Zn-dependent insulinase-like peptidase
VKHTVEEIILKNGAKGLLVHVPDAMVLDVYLNFRAGEYLVDRDKWEAPHLMEHVLLGANDIYPRARDFQAVVEQNGAYSNASTGPTTTTVNWVPTHARRTGWWLRLTASVWS